MTSKHVVRLHTQRHDFAVSIRHGSDTSWIADVAVVAEQPGSVISCAMKIKHGQLASLKNQIKEQVEAYGGPMDAESRTRLADLVQR